MAKTNSAARTVAVRADRAGHRGDPQRRDDHRRRRRGSRERRGSDDRGRQDHAGGGHLHGEARPRPDLRADDRGSARPSSIFRRWCRRTRRGSTRRSASASKPSTRPAPGSPPAIGRRRCWRSSIRRTRPGDLARPGHMFPLKARTGGVLVRAGQTEAAVDLARIAGLYPAGVICEIMNDDGTMARVPELTKFAKRHKLLMITIADLIQYRMRTEALVRRVANAALPTDHGDFRVTAYESVIDRETHVALVKGGHRRRRERARARPLALPDRRRLPFRALRLRPAARGGDVTHRAGGARRAAVSEPGGARHRAGEQDSRVRASGSGARHGRSERAARDSSRTSATTGSAFRFSKTSASARCGCCRTTRASSWASRATSSPSWTGCRSRCRRRQHTQAYLRTKKEKLGHKLSSV